MDDDEWHIRCAKRLQRRWPSISIDELHATAVQLADDDRLRQRMPEDAAIWWLQQGVLASSRSD